MRKKGFHFEWYRRTVQSGLIKISVYCASSVRGKYL